MPPKDSESKDAVELTAPSDSKKDDKKKKSDELAIQPDSLSEEDKELKERLETCVDTVSKEPETKLRLNALQIMVTELRTATSSMTSVPKPLKFLRPLFPILKDAYQKLPKEPENDQDMLMLRARLADVLAVLAMTLASTEESPRESLQFKLAAMRDHTKLHESKMSDADEEKDDNLGSWGHEFVRSLAGEIGQEYNARVVNDGADPDSDEPFADLLSMVKSIVPFHVSHNAEAEAVDLLIEVQRLQYLLEFEDLIDETNSQRICLYLIKTADYMSDPDDYVVSGRTGVIRM